MQIVTVSEQGTVVIPLDIRKHLGITPGCQLSFIPYEPIFYNKLWFSQQFRASRNKHLEFLSVLFRVQKPLSFCYRSCFNV